LQFKLKQAEKEKEI